MSNDLPHDGKQIIGIVVCQSFQYSISGDWCCHIKPLLIQENDEWKDATNYDFPNNGHVWWKLYDRFEETQPGKMISARLHTFQEDRPDKSRYYVKAIKDVSLDGFFELFVLTDCDEDKLRNRSSFTLKHFPELPLYVQCQGKV